MLRHCSAVVVTLHKIPLTVSFALQIAEQTTACLSRILRRDERGVFSSLNYKNKARKNFEVTCSQQLPINLAPTTTTGGTVVFVSSCCITLIRHRVKPRASHTASELPQQPSRGLLCSKTNERGQPTRFLTRNFESPRSIRAALAVCLGWHFCNTQV